MPITVRSPQPRDEAGIDEVERLATVDLRKVYRPSAAAVEHRASLAQQLQRLVATVNDRVVGTVQFYFAEDRLALLGLGVHPEFRRLGVARALVRELERVAESSGAEALTLYTIRQTGATQIFECLGFGVESEEPASLFESTSSGPLTEVFMRKDVRCHD
ncbi:MAG: GNAT family N-acetyltransferase [Planctomycetota bacterium]|jgi:ribosomal protein S18 acetylase RimI-like enzyme